MYLVVSENYEQTLFEKIIAREIPATIVFEDDLVFAVRDINPQAPKHVLIIPKKPSRVSPRPDRTTKVARAYAAQSRRSGRPTGFEGKRLPAGHQQRPGAGESVPHLHLHILGGSRMAWPPG